MTSTPYNFGTHTRYFPRGECDYTMNALHSDTGDVIKIVSPQKLAERFGIKNYTFIYPNQPIGHYALSVNKGVTMTFPLESFRDSVIRVVYDFTVKPYKLLLENCVTRGALNKNSKTVQAVSLPIVYKCLFGVELNHQQKLDLGLVIRNAIPEVKRREKVLTIHSETNEPIWILHYTLDDFLRIVDVMLKMHNL